MKKDAKIFILLFVSFILIRLILLFTSNSVHYPDDYFYGSMARELVNGADFSWYELAFDTYIGGSILTIYLMAILFKVFGIFRYSVNIIPTLYSILMFVFYYLLTKRNYNKNVHLISVLFLVFAPFNFIKFSMIPGGDFFAGAALSVIIFFLLFEILRKEKVKNHSIVILGLLCGYGILHQYLIIISTLLCSFFLILKYKLHKKVIIFFSSFFLGFIPFLFFNFIYLKGFPKRLGVDILSINNIMHFFKKLFYSVFIELRNSTTYGYPILKTIYWCIFFIGLLFFIFKSLKIMGNSKKDLRQTILEKRKYVYPLLFLLIFFATYSNSYVGDFKENSLESMTSTSDYLINNLNTENEFYYFSIWPLLFLTLAISIESIPNKWFKGIIILLVITLSLITILHFSNSYPFTKHRWAMNYCNENCFGANWNEFTEEDIPHMLVVNGNTPGYRFFLRYYQQSVSSDFGKSYPIYLCSKMATIDGKQSCFKIVEKSFEFYENKTGKDICVGENKLHNEKCLDYFNEKEK